MLQHLAQGMGAEGTPDGVGISGTSLGAMEDAAQALSAAAAGEVDAMSEGGLSAELEAELATELADLSDNSPRSFRSEDERAPALNFPNAGPASSQTRCTCWILSDAFATYEQRIMLSCRYYL